MKLLIILTMMLIPSITQASPMILPIVEIYDGDTIKTRMTLPPPLNKVSVRLLGIDTPEMPAKSYYKTGKLGRAKCIKEAELAIQAKKLVVDLASKSSIMEIYDFKWGKYGSRVVARVEINGVDISKHLIELGFAVDYNGGTKSHSWCDK